MGSARPGESFTALVAGAKMSLGRPGAMVKVIPQVADYFFDKGQTTPVLVYDLYTKQSVEMRRSPTHERAVRLLVPVNNPPWVKDLRQQLRINNIQEDA